MKSPAIVKSLVCDDIRVEQSGKAILIGVYPGNVIGVVRVPQRVQFSCYMEVMYNEETTFAAKFRVIDKQNEEKTSGGMTLLTFPNLIFPVHFLHINFEAHAAGTYKVQWSLNDGEWQDVSFVDVQETTRGEKSTKNVYIEARPRGRPEGSHVDDYVVEDHADHVLQTFKTQREAIEWAKAQGHRPVVARVRHLNDKKVPGHWRAA